MTEQGPPTRPSAAPGSLHGPPGELADLRRDRDALRRRLSAAEGSLDALRSSRGWRAYMFLTRPLRAWRRRHSTSGNHQDRFPLPGPPPKGAEDVERAARELRSNPFPIEAGYLRWIEQYDRLSVEQQAQMEAFVNDCKSPPRISVLMPVYNVEERWLRQAIESVRAQTYPHWELCIADDQSSAPHVRRVLEEYRAGDPRVKVVFRARNGHISAASNSALALATGEYVALMDHDDMLPPHALYFVSREILAHPSAGLIYSDEDKVDVNGSRFGHYFKPDFNPDLMLSHNMISHLGVYRRSLVEAIGGFRRGFEGSQDYDLALRVIARLEPHQIRHIPRVLYHWRALPESTATGADAKPYALDNAIKAVGGYLRAQHIDATVTQSPLVPGMLRVRYPLPETPLVSIIIPTRNGLELIRRCVYSIAVKTEYKPYEILVVDNASDDSATLDYLQGMQAQGSIRVLRYPGPFNFSAINNVAAGRAEGDLLAFLNNDLEAINPDWLGEMVRHTLRPDVGAVGARLWYPDQRLQHGGVVLGLGGVAGHAMKNLPGKELGYMGRAALIQNYSAVTAACMMIRHGLFDLVGGFDETHLPVAFNDVDLCLRVRERGYRNLWTPHAEFYHHESASRGREDTREKQLRFLAECDYMRTRWGELLANDPAYNPNLTLVKEDFSLRWG